MKINDYQNCALCSDSCWLRYNALKVKEILRLPVNWSKVCGENRSGLHAEILARYEKLHLAPYKGL